jgi:hypothetical protein
VSAPPQLPRPLPPSPSQQPWPSSAHWRGRRELTADLVPAGWVLLALALAGVAAGVLWWALAPRADFRITDEGPVVVGSPSSELLVADDGVYVLILAALGLIAGVAAWLIRRHRGVGLLLALAAGTTIAGALAWLVGGLLGHGPSDEELANVGGTVTSGLGLGSSAALAVAPFVALLVYLLGVIMNADDGLGRGDDEPALPALPGQDAALPRQGAGEQDDSVTTPNGRPPLS